MRPNSEHPSSGTGTSERLNPCGGAPSTLRQARDRSPDVRKPRKRYLPGQQRTRSFAPDGPIALHYRSTAIFIVRWYPSSPVVRRK